MITDIDVAWAAGFYEGEGNASGGRKRTFSMRISQVNPEPLNKMAHLFGGKLYEIKRNPPSQNAFSWQLHGANAKEFANRIYPILSEKRRRQIMIAFMSLPVPKRPIDKEEQKIRRSFNSKKWWQSKGKLADPSIVKIPAPCHPDRNMHALGLCSPCYQEKYYKERVKGG